MIHTNDLEQALQANQNKKQVKETVEFSINEYKELVKNNVEDLKEILFNLGQNSKRLMYYYIDLEALKLMDLNDNMLLFTEEHIKTSNSDMNETKWNLEELLYYKQYLKKHPNKNDNTFVSKSVMNVNELSLASKYIISSAENKILKGVSKVLRK